MALYFKFESAKDFKFKSVQASTLADDEDSKIKAFVDSSANDWQRQIQEGVGGSKGYGSKGQGRGPPQRGGYSGRGGLEKDNPLHAGYVCHRCGVAGHYIQHCATNGDPTYDKKKVRAPTGIPKSMLVANPDGSYALPTGEVAVLEPNEGAFEREVEGLPSSSRPILDIPPDLCCPLCTGVLTEAVLTSKCCFKSYCDECIRNEFISKRKCLCGATNVLADDLLPNKTLRDAINRFLEPQASAATSSGNIGSRAELSDMESAPYARPKVSISLKEASSAIVESDFSGNYESLAGGNVDLPSQVLASAKSRGSSGTRPENDGEALHPATKGVEVADASPECQPPEDTAEETVRAERPVKPDQDLRNGGLSEPVKGMKKTKGCKRPRQGDLAYAEGMWNQGDLNYFNSQVQGDPNYFNSQVQGDPNYYNSQVQGENCCMHCASYEHPSWNCYMMDGPGPSHHPHPMHGPLFRPGFTPQMMGMLHPPMGEGYMMPYHQNPGFYTGHGHPYEFQFNEPMGPPDELFVPSHNGMMPYGPPPPMQRDFVDTNLMSREEFEARKAELQRRNEREQRVGREHVKYPSTELDFGSTRSKWKVGPRLVSPSKRNRRISLDLPDEQDVETRLHWNGEQRRRSQIRISRPREVWNEEEKIQASSGAEGSAHRDCDVGKAHERWNARHDDEASSELEDLSRDGRYSRGETGYSTKQKARNYPSKASGRSGQDGARSGQKRSVSGYDSKDDGDLRRQSRSIQVGPSSLCRASFRSTDSDDLPSQEVEHNPEDNSDTHAKGGKKDVKAINTRERPRGSLFDRTNLPIKPRGTVENEYNDAGNDREFIAKRMKVAGSRARDSREQVLRDFEDSSLQRSGVVLRKRRAQLDF